MTEPKDRPEVPLLFPARYVALHAIGGWLIVLALALAGAGIVELWR